MKKLFFTFTFLCTYLFSSIEGVVLNQKNEPVPNLEVLLKEKGLKSITDADGKFSFPVEEGIYEIIILNETHKINFKAKTAKIFIKTFGEEILIEPPGAMPSFIPEFILNQPKTSIAENLTTLPDISLNGLGGAFQTVSIGGMAKQRVQIEVNGYKIEGLRRAGTDFGTYHPDLFKSLNLYEVGLGFTHGSNAMGGTIDFELPLEYKEVLSTAITYGTNDKNKSVSVFLSNKNFNFFSGYQEAGQYWDGNGDRQDGYYKRANIYSSFKFGGEENLNILDILLTNGWDIGKPFLSSDKTEYPENNLHLIGLRGYYKNLQYQFGTYYQDLETKTTKERSFFKSINLQGKLFYKKENYSLGFELNSYPKFYASNELSTGHNQPLKDADKYDASIFASYELNMSSKFKLFSGLRLNYFTSSSSEKKKDETIPGVFLRISSLTKYKFDFSVFNIYRFPSIEELFYTGMTARGYVQGNEKLKSEKGMGASFQLRKSIKENEIGLSVTYKNAKNYIERYKVSKDLYSYKNTDEVEIWQGTIYFDGGFYFANLSFSSGKNKETNEPIDDQKPLSLNFGFMKMIGNFEPFLNFSYVDELSEPGPNEIERDDYFIINAGLNLYSINDFVFSLKCENILDENYIPQGDEKAIPQIGRNFILSIIYKK